jgi:hypothetical protein
MRSHLIFTISSFTIVQSYLIIFNYLFTIAIATGAKLNTRNLSSPIRFLNKYQQTRKSSFIFIKSLFLELYASKLICEV